MNNVTPTTQRLHRTRPQPFSIWNPPRGIWGNDTARPLRAAGAMLGDLVDLRRDA